MSSDAIKLIEDGSLRQADVQLSFGDIELASTQAANVVVGDRSIDFFFDPNNFPTSYDGDTINMEMRWTEDSETMVIQRLQRNSNSLYSADSRVASSASIDVGEMNDFQKTVAFLYLVGEVMNRGC